MGYYYLLIEIKFKKKLTDQTHMPQCMEEDPTYYEPVL